MMHCFVKSIETPITSTFERAATLRLRIAALDYLSQLYGQGKLGFFFRSPDGSISYELHRANDLLELDARLKANPQWPYATHEVIPVTKTGEMVRELTGYLGIDPNAFFAATLSSYQQLSLMTADHVNTIQARLASVGGDYLALMSADEEPIDDAGTYTVVQKATPGPSAVIPVEQLHELWMRTLRSQVAHLNSDIELVDYNPVGRSEGLLVAKGDPAVIKRHIESTEVFPDTVVTYFPVATAFQAGQTAVDSLKLLRRDIPSTQFLRLV